ncbi:MAG TPA: peptidoglycan DD-metalloendopeptidase family protein, partial [Thermohalobaculum sp.]|nr:peptidoglycan DD-metalloendopeptidase family protein [Thermohalobaculum sp.]
ARVAGGFGAPDPWGRPGKGLTLEAPGFAQITAPWDATVRFAGALIDYGQVVVLEPEADYLLVLAGLANVDREAGEAVLAGERLGDLGAAIPASEQFLLDAGAEDGQISLTAFYVEIRHAGETLDPAEWFDLKGSEAIR